MHLQLTISLLVSTNIHSIRRCLDSLVPILMQIPSELIIVQTNEDPQIRELALQYTDHVIPFRWCDDFAKARNAGLEAAKGEWFLYIDDDEWFEDPGEIIRFFTTGEYKNYNSAAYIVRNYTEWTGNRYTDAHLGRMCRLTPKTKFSGTVHEYLDPYKEPIRMFSAYAHHYGYVETATEAKTDRNLPLLEKELAEHDPHSHDYLQLCQEYMSDQQYAKAETYAFKCLELNEFGKEKERSWCAAYLPYLIYSQKDYPRAFETGMQMLRHSCCTEIAALRIYVDLIQICGCLKNREKDIIVYAKAYHQYLRRLDARPEQWLEQAIGGLGEQHIKSMKDTISLLGFESAIQTEDTKSAMFFLQCFPWGNGEAEKLYPSFCNILRDKNKEDFLLNLFEQLDISDPFVFVAKSRMAWKNGKQEEAEKYFRLTSENGSLLVFIEAALLSFQSKGEISLEPLMDRIDLSQLENISYYLTGNVYTAELPDWIGLTRSYLSAFPIQALSLLIAFQEKLLIEGVLQIDDSELFSEIKRYCQWIQEYYTFIYNKHILSSGQRNLLPSNYRFAVQMEQVFQDLESFNYPQVLKGLHKAINIYKPLCGAIRRMLSVIVDEMNQTGAANPEFLSLADQVKQMVQHLLQENRYIDALPLVQQLSTLLPKDLEVVRLRQELWSRMGE